eukprot:TRINITY_DN56908_c0_g1_i1.p3 TRINITY_DN56908_c0_g1~~TRINITY_DN56908_c0_g1_i1.p3  ORF type:complete len:125 (-),score=0.57 TRINITY_DN56908_c0_g1_i1:45-419(-)
MLVGSTPEDRTGSSTPLTAPAPTTWRHHPPWDGRDPAPPPCLPLVAEASQAVCHLAGRIERHGCRLVRPPQHRLPAHTPCTGRTGSAGSLAGSVGRVAARRGAWETALPRVCGARCAATHSGLY